MMGCRMNSYDGAAAILIILNLNIGGPIKVGEFVCQLSE